MVINVEEQLAISLQVQKWKELCQYTARDYSLDYLVQLFRAGEIHINERYMTIDKWRRNPFNKYHFIENLLIGMPIPFIVCARQKDGTYELIDGERRIRTVAAFMLDSFALRRLDRLSLLNGFTYSELPDTLRQEFDHHNVRVLLLDEKCTYQMRRCIYTFLNGFEEACALDAPTLFGVKFFRGEPQKKQQ